MLDTKGIVFREIPNRFFAIQIVIEKAIKAWEIFCNLPTEEKEKFGFMQFETDWADPGYRRKSKGENHDGKDFFHVLSSNDVFLNMLGMNHQGIPREASSFMTEATLLHKLLVEYIASKSVYLDLCEDGGLENRLINEIVFSKKLITLRFLRYIPEALGTEIATPHVDKSGLSIHLYSSHPGLQYIQLGSPVKRLENAVWDNLEVPAGNVAIFGGYQAQAFFDGRIQPLVHRVVQSENRGPRYSIVAFFPFLHTHRFPKDKRIQKYMAELGYFSQ